MFAGGDDDLPRQPGPRVLPQFCCWGRDDGVTARPSHPQDGQVVGLGSAAGKDEPVAAGSGQIGVENRRDPLPGVFQHAAGLLAGLMLAGRIGIILGVTPPHGLHHFRPGRRCRIMVKIDGLHEQIVADLDRIREPGYHPTFAGGE